ncbi:MAG: Ig-like domain-containing protein, partial [Eubacteriales bacterium]
MVALALLVLVASAFVVGCAPKEPDVTPPASSSITLDKETLSLDADVSEQLVASGANEVVWDSDNKAVATVDANGKVTGVNAGTCKITASTKDGKYQAECVVTVTGYHLSEKVVTGINKIENNTYNGEINYAIDNSDENAFVVSYDRSKMTNKWASLVLWYDCSLNATSFELEFEIVKGSLPVIQFEFGGESSFKQFERYTTNTGKNTIRLNTTDLDLDGEGSWKAIYLELNNPCPLEGTTDENLGETVIRFTKIAMVVGEKSAPEAPATAEVKDGVVYWDRVLAAAEYELEVDGVAVTDLGARTRPSGDAPVMRRAYKPTEAN